MTVNTTADTLDKLDGELSLRRALWLSYSGDTINLDVTGTVVLAKNLGRLTVLAGVGIAGPGPLSLILSGEEGTQVLYVQEAFRVVSVSGVTIANGYDVTPNNGSGPLGNDGGIGGAGVYNWGTLKLADCFLYDNSAMGVDGGAVFNRGALELTDCYFGANTTTYNGGAVYNRGGVVTVDGTEFELNSAGSFAGALFNIQAGDLGGDISVTDSAFTHNEAGIAGAIRNSSGSTITVENSTFEGNASSSDGGAILNHGDLTLVNTTLSANTASRSGGGLYLAEGSAAVTNCTITENGADLLNSGVADGGGIFREGGALSLHNTIVAANYDTLNSEGVENLGNGNIHADVSGEATSLGHNLIGIGNGTYAFADGVNGDRVGSTTFPLDPMLGPLADYGGPTLTHTPMVQSPVIDVGDPLVEPDDLPKTDQRSIGFTRLADGDGDGEITVDIGAVEFETTAPVFVSEEETEAREDDLYLYVIVTEDVDLDEVFTITAPVKPDWLSLTDVFREIGGSITLAIPDPVDADMPIQWLKDEIELVDDPEPDDSKTIIGATTQTLVIDDLSLSDSGAYTAVYSDADGEQTFGPVNLEIVEAGVLPIAGVADIDNVSLTPVLSGRPANEDIGVPFETAVHSVVLQVEDWAHATAQQEFAIAIMGVNDPPNAVDDYFVVEDDDGVETEYPRTDEDTAVVIGVLDNDSDDDGLLDKSSVVVSGPPAHGATSVHPTLGKVTYTPDADYNGTDTFEYRVHDFGKPEPAKFSTATVTVTVAAINDPPVAAPDYAVTDEDTPVTIDVAGNGHRRGRQCRGLFGSGGLAPRKRFGYGRSRDWHYHLHAGRRLRG